MKILVVIAARGGSKGVRNKNIREMCGIPLIAHTIKQALSWGRASRVIVSTDSREIAEAARRAGAEVPFMRPPELATDSIGKLPVMKHALEASEKVFGEEYARIVDLDPTAPLRRVADIEGAFNAAAGRGAPVLFSVVPARKNPYFNMVELEPDGTARLSKQPAAPVYSRQSAPQVYDMNASIYVYKSDIFRSGCPSSLFMPGTSVYVMPPVSGRDIDTEDDLRFTEHLMREGVWSPDYD